MTHSYREIWAVSSGGGARNLRRHGCHDRYDSFTARRNFLTKIAAILHGEGTEFRIFFR
ncbi:MAG: hypothetical protein ILA04_03470 [Prevotella sp.]|nr:hypothetical protein [Prevotella sp.]